MRTFGAEQTGIVRTVARTSLLRQFRATPKGAEFSGERERVMASLRQARIAGIRVPVATEVFSLKLAGLPAG